MAIITMQNMTQRPNSADHVQSSLVSDQTKNTLQYISKQPKKIDFSRDFSLLMKEGEGVDIFFSPYKARCFPNNSLC